MKIALSIVITFFVSPLIWWFALVEIERVRTRARERHRRIADGASLEESL